MSGRSIHELLLGHERGGELRSLTDPNAPTLRGPGGMPTAPGGVSISISHSRRFAVALASNAPDVSVGVDIEPIESHGRDEWLAERILSEEERAPASEREPIPLPQRLSLKEAAYKVLFPKHGHIPLREIAVLRLPDAPPIQPGTPPLPLGEDSETCSAKRSVVDPRIKSGGGEGRVLLVASDLCLAPTVRPSPTSPKRAFGAQGSVSSPNGRGGVPLNAFNVVATAARMPVDAASIDLHGHILSLARVG